jgi:protein SDA1
VRAVADNFITERNSPEAICVGLNTIREVCSRCPLAISADLLQDLTQYQKYHNKNVVMGARSLINLYRSVNPVLLAKRDKGRVNGTNLVKEYGAMNAVDYVPGTELMDIHIDNNSDEEDNSSDGEEFKNESNKLYSYII